jgi:aspartate/methionine/tyrosine aminotransferase
MGSFLDSLPNSGIVRIRELMYAVERPFRLDQGDPSFDAPGTMKDAMRAAIDANQTHYLQTAGLPRLKELLAAKLRERNAVPVADAEDVLVTNGGVHGIYLAAQALVEPGDEVIVPDPEWPPATLAMLAARASVVRCPLRPSLGWRLDVDELASKIGPRTKGLYLNSPNNPSGGVLTRDDIERIADLARAHGLWVISDEAYEDLVYDGAAHVSIASLPGMYERTVPVYTLSKTYAATGVRVGYLAVRDERLRDRVQKLLFLTTSNVSSISQHGAIGALEGSQDIVELYRSELQARRDLFYAGIREAAGHVFTGDPPPGAFYAFMRIDPAWAPPAGIAATSRSWAMVEHLVAQGRIGCVPGVDFGPASEGYVRFCFARDREELQGALREMKRLFAQGALTASRQ